MSPPAGAELEAGQTGLWARTSFRGHWLLAGETLTDISGRPLRVIFGPAPPSQKGLGPAPPSQRGRAGPSESAGRRGPCTP